MGTGGKLGKKLIRALHLSVFDEGSMVQNVIQFVISFHIRSFRSISRFLLLFFFFFWVFDVCCLWIFVLN